MDYPQMSSFLRFSVFIPKVLEIQPNFFTHPQWSGTILFHLSYPGLGKLLSHVQLFATPYSPWNSPGQNTGVGNLSLTSGSSQPRNQSPALQVDSAGLGVPDESFLCVLLLPIILQF